LAASKVLFSLYPSAGSITFQTRWAGDLEAANISEDVVEITLPISPIDPSAATPDKLALCKAIGVQESDVLGLEVVSPGTGSLVIELKDEIDLRSLQVDFKALVR
jgi:predicted PhzF superfamily epimerase YddE/YHI9